MSRYQMVVLSNPMPGREQECEQWYQNEHLKDMVSLPGFQSAQRFQLAHPMPQTEPYQYLAIYTIETDDIDQVLKGLVTAAESGDLQVSDALDRENTYAAIYEVCGEMIQEKA